MTRIRFAYQLVITSLLALLLSSCFNPPFNNFKPHHRAAKDAALGAGIGSYVGYIAGPTLVGTGVGAVAFTAAGAYKNSKPQVIKALSKVDIQYIQYGNTSTLIVPTDRYFFFNSARIKENCYHGLNLIIRLLAFYPGQPIYVAGFTDNIGSRYHKNKLSQARAEAMLTFLWANNIPAKLLSAEGYGDKHDVSDNTIIHGSAQNRRLEIQWINAPYVNSQVTQPVSGYK